MRVFLTVLVLLNFSALSLPTAAQSSPAVMQAEIDALQRQLRILQRRVDGSGVPTDARVPDQQPASERRLLADMLAKMGSLERQVRQLNGRLEEYEYRQNEMMETLAQLRTQMARQREQMLALPAGAGSVAPAQASAEPVPADTQPATDDAQGDVLPVIPAEQVVTIELPEGDPAAQYAYAFSFIRKNDLDSGRTAMEKFMAANPEDAQVANAKFWLGRINMQQSRNAEAAQLFLSLIEDHPNHDKRIDALVDLSDVLIALGAADDACNALAEFRRIEDKASERLRARARRVSETARCNIF